MLFTSILAVIFLKKKKLYRHHFLGGFLAISGIVLVGLGALINSGPKAGETKVIGVILLICANILAASQFIVEEKLLTGCTIHPLKMVFWEGVWGSSIYLTLMIILAQIPCGEYAQQNGMCTEVNGEWWFEAPIFAIRQMFDIALLASMVFLFIFSIASFNYSGIAITKYLSSPVRAVLISIATILVWFYCLLLPKSITLTLSESFITLQLFGFIIQLSGTLIFVELIVLPFLGLNKYTAKELKEQKEKKRRNRFRK